jgi:gas vesicle protein
LNEFFAIQTPDYKALASLYCLLEAQNNNNVIDPQYLVNYKSTLLEHLTTQKQNADDVKDTLIEEYSKYDKDLKLLTFKILLEKFNDTYKDLLPEQKNILKEFITSVNSQTRLRNLVNKELTKISTSVNKLTERVQDEVVKIKLEEVVKSIKPLSNKERINDNHLVNLMQYYDLVNELNSLK